VGSQVGQRVVETGGRIVNRVDSLANSAIQSIRSAWTSLRETTNRVHQQVRGALDGARQSFNQFRDTARERYLQPAMNWAQARWESFKGRVLGLVSKITNGWQRLRSWADWAKAMGNSDNPADQEALRNDVTGRITAPFESIFFKSRLGGAREEEDPGMVRASLLQGKPLEAGVRSRMESAYGQSFGGVRVHTDAGAAKVSDRLNARALTVGSDIAFAPGEYQPGSPIGDALIAHELAHVIQQSSGFTQPSPKALGQDSELEMDADRSAMSAVAAAYTGKKDALSRLPKEALPRLRSGLRLSSCKKGIPEGMEAPTVTFGTVNTPGDKGGEKERIPPRVPYSVPVTVNGWKEGMGPVEVVSMFQGRPSERIKVSNKEIPAGGTQNVSVVGEMVASGDPQYYLVAKIGDTELKGKSNEFVIAAFPTGVTFTSQGTIEAKDIGGLLHWGAMYAPSLTSDSGNPEDLKRVEVTENIDAKRSGFFSQIKIGVSSYRSALSPEPDVHGIANKTKEYARVLIDGEPGSSSEQTQFFAFYDTVTGNGSDRNHKTPVVPNSGFKAKISVSKKDGKYYVHVSKEGFDSGAGAGTVTDSSAKSIEV